jgi:hypothetical protein
MYTYKVLSGEHAGWWCAKRGSVGVYGRTRESAIKQLKMVLGL